MWPFHAIGLVLLAYLFLLVRLLLSLQLNSFFNSTFVCPGLPLRLRLLEQPALHHLSRSLPKTIANSMFHLPHHSPV